MASTAHFIWVGDINDAKKRFAIGLGPKSLATHSPEQPIKVWVPAGTVTQAQELFSDHDNIEVCSIDDKLAELDELDPGTIDKIRTVFNDEDVPNVAKKDFLTPVILNQEGGYFFDTTCQFYDKPELPELGDNDFKVELNSAALAEKSAEIWFAPDVWAVAAANRSRFTLEAIQENLYNYRRSPSKDDKSGPMFVTVANVTKNLFCRESLEEIYSRPDYKVSEEVMERLRPHLWVRESQRGPAGSHHVEELKLNKFTLGLWRINNARDWLDNKQTLYDHLMQESAELDYPYRAKLLDYCQKTFKNFPTDRTFPGETQRFLINLITMLRDDKTNAEIPITDVASLDQIIQSIQNRVDSTDFSKDGDVYSSGDLKSKIETVYRAFHEPEVVHEPRAPGM